MERLNYYKPRKAGKVIATLGATAGLSLGLSTAPASAKEPLNIVQLVPNMSGFHKPGHVNECFNDVNNSKAGLRPCALLLRTMPGLAAPMINAPSQGIVPWPKEAYKTNQGNKLDVVCYDSKGQLITSYEGDSISTYWYAVEVPEKHILNPAVKAELNQNSSDLSTIKIDHQTVLLGWASVEWFHQNTPNPNVPKCS